MSDPVASKSGSLCMYMKNHPDTLVSYVKYFGKVEDSVLTAEMSSIDSKGMTLLYKLESGPLNTIRVPFNPLLSGYDHVKPRLLSMKAEALEGLGMLKAPQLTTFRFPPKAAMTPFVFLAYFYLLSPPPPGTTFLSIPVTTLDAFFSPAHAFRHLTGLGFSFRTLSAIICAIHGAEGLYTWSLCRRFVKATVVTAAYVGCTVLFGFHIWKDLKRRVQEKRMENVAK
ncbi:hypothetical protein EDB19DRAFT_1981680, partial [Suillus lakei]